MILTELNYNLFAAKAYTNPNCSSVAEFEDDLNRIKYLKKLFYLYKKKEILRERLILNHLTILYNVFEPRSCTKMLFLKLDEYQESLSPFLLFMGYLPEKITGLISEENCVNTVNINMDRLVIARLREISKNAG